MKTTTLLLSALIVTGFFVVLAPAAEARGFCASAVDDWCPAFACATEQLCTDSFNPDCVTEPCPGLP